MRVPRLDPLRIGVGVGLCAMLASVWGLMHRYRGLTNDAQIYAFQALARLRPALAADIYLQNTSQDQFTIFSSLYAAAIRTLGLEEAALLLTLLFTALFYAASWNLARELAGAPLAWLCTAMLIIVVGHYGGSGVFHTAEDFLTARLATEALIATALALYFRGFARIALLIAGAALFVHPLMALPGVLLLICLSLPMRLCAVGAVLAVLAVLAVALAGTHMPAVPPLLTLMDAPWLEVVRERSQFLFLELWSPKDWEVNVRPFLCLTLTALVIRDARVRKLCAAAMLLGATGLICALIAGTVGPVALLVQGQAWRWVWLTEYSSVLLLVPTIWQLRREQRGGAVAAILLIAAWTFPTVDSIACICLALLLWSIRSRMSARVAGFLRWGAIALGIVIVAWICATSWNDVFSAPAESGRQPILLQRLRNLFGLQISAVLLVWAAWSWIERRRSWRVAALAALMLAAGAAFVLPTALKQIGSVPTAAQIAEFQDWRDLIPPEDNVLVAKKIDSGSFAWFTLNRPNYLSPSQSAGVVFSRATALEVRRRAEVLLPLMDPEWRILSSIRRKNSGVKPSGKPSFRPLTAASLASLCADAALGFVVAKQNLGFGAVAHRQAGDWKDWNLYDCRHVRAAAPPP